MRCIGPCGKNHPPKDIVWGLGRGEYLCRWCFPGYREIALKDRRAQIALGLPCILPKPREAKGDIKGQAMLWEE